MWCCFSFFHSFSGMALSWTSSSQLGKILLNATPTTAGNTATIINKKKKNRLKIKRAVQSDTGNYTCVPTMAKSSSVYAHVISGKLWLQAFFYNLLSLRTYTCGLGKEEFLCMCGFLINKRYLWCHTRKVSCGWYTKGGKSLLHPQIVWSHVCWVG